MVHERDRDSACLQAHGLLAVLVDHVVAAVLAGGARLADARVGACERLEFQSDVLRDVAQPRPLLEPREEAATPAQRAGVLLHRGQQRLDRVGEAEDRVGRELLEHAQVHQHPDDRTVRPDVGAAQDARLHDAQGGLRARGDGGGHVPRWLRLARHGAGHRGSSGAGWRRGVGRRGAVRRRIRTRRARRARGAPGRRRGSAVAGRSDIRRAASGAPRC